MGDINPSLPFHPSHPPQQGRLLTPKRSQTNKIKGHTERLVELKTFEDKILILS